MLIHQKETVQEKIHKVHFDRNIPSNDDDDNDIPPPEYDSILFPKIPEKPLLDNFARPITKIIGDKDHTIEITPKKTVVEEANLSEHLQEIFPDLDEATKEDIKFKNEVQNLTKVLSRIGDDAPFEFEFFSGGKNEKFSEYFKSLGPSTDNLEFLDFLESEICKKDLKDNKLKIHIETGNIYYNNIDTNESIFNFIFNQQNPITGYIKHKFIYDRDYISYFDWLVNGFATFEQNKLDVFKFKNSKYLFYRFNNFLEESNFPIQKIKYSTTTEDYIAAEEIQN